jgi:outer membrane lipoprotein-sorting protein
MKQELPFQGVYRLDDQGNLRLLIKDIAQPNGLAFSPDGKHFYVDDDEEKNIRVYDVTADESLANGRVFGDEKGGKGEGVPDGMKIDKEGNLFVVGPKGIWVWDATGNHLGTIVTPEQPANLTWGDKDYRTLYITATTSVYRLRTTTVGFVPYLGDLDSILDKMDRTAAGFRAAHADFNWTLMNSVVNDKFEQTGRIYFKRSNGATKMFAEIDPPDAEQVLYSGGKFKIYKQKLGTVDIYEAGTHRDEAETLLVLGFGSSGAEIRKSFDVKYAGEEEVGDVLAAKLELTPKSESIRNHFPEILLWIDPEKGISIQQKLIEKNDSYRLARYSNIRLNENLSDKVFKLKTSGKITITNH